MRLTQYLASKLKNFSNLPKEYIERSKKQVYWQTPKEINYLPRTVERKRFRYTTNRSWTGEFRQQNMPGTVRRKVLVEPIEDWSFFRGDRIEVLVGKDKGKQGIVTQVIPERNWVIVEGLNWHYRKVGGEKEFPGIIIKSEAPLHVTKDIRLVDPSDLQGTDFEWRFTEEGEKVRVSLRSGRIISVPETNNQTHDYKTPNAYIEREKDTPGAVVGEITFQPKLSTFEMDIMEEMDIKEERTPVKSYWY
ncbi:probable 39S ribosomal protein L24, mitochondrial [Drosophila sechellia]|uniref:Large ribosomal subunit protein uL24m n=1 Tax=Drosophila sechellia TaxID=7238 RepID=B4I186_DROSE|nr:probable 39S ribosomal protein L24, mitochondrial [Drosophila sechellia]EDW54293.1 GM18061 [Drosophila sechellia]